MHSSYLSCSFNNQRRVPNDFKSDSETCLSIREKASFFFTESVLIESVFTESIFPKFLGYSSICFRSNSILKLILLQIYEKFRLMIIHFELKTLIINILFNL